MNDTATDGFDDEDTLSSIENLTGSAHDDLLTGDADPNTLTGGEGDDVLLGLGGDDTLEGGAGEDDIQGGDGTDTASYAGDEGGVDVALDGTATDGYGDSDTLGDEGSYVDVVDVL